MTDKLTDLHRRLVDVTSRLAAAALDDLAGAAFPSSGDGPPVLGGGTSRPTETAVDRLAWARDYQQILGAFADAVGDLEGLERRMKPQSTGAMCPTQARDGHGELVRCTGTVTHEGRCFTCWRWHRANPGLSPDADLLAEWNGRRPRECACGPDCCPDGCLDLIPAGKKARVSDRCRQRRSRARRGSTVGTGGAFGWQDPA